MRLKRHGLVGTILVAMFFPFLLFADDPSPPAITDFYSTGAQKGLSFSLYPGAQAYTILGATNLSLPFAADTNFFIAGYNVTNYFTNVVSGTNVIGASVQ